MSFSNFHYSLKNGQKFKGAVLTFVKTAPIVFRDKKTEQIFIYLFLFGISIFVRHFYFCTSLRNLMLSAVFSISVL